MQFPDKPTCHDVDYQAQRFGGTTWRAPLGRREPYQDDYRSCSYCGSIHPEDLIKLLKDGKATLGGADWKYGWPHKFYVTAPNPLAGQEVKVGSRSYRDGDRYVDESIMGNAPQTMTLKWYNFHLMDEYDEEAFKELTALLSKHAGIVFEKNEKGMWYRSPCHDYQK